MQRFSHVLLAALVVAALFGGNCLSCPQVLMAIAGHPPVHNCCHHPSTKIDCHSQQLSHFVKAPGGVTPAALAVVDLADTTRPALTASRAAAVVPGLRLAPPDLLSLYSHLRV